MTSDVRNGWGLLLKMLCKLHLCTDLPQTQRIAVVNKIIFLISWILLLHVTRLEQIKKKKSCQKRHEM